MTMFRKDTYIDQIMQSFEVCKGLDLLEELQMKSKNDRVVHLC